MKYRVPSAIRIIVLVVSFALSVSAIGTIADLWHKRDIIAQRKAELAQISHKNQTLKDKLSEAQSESYVEKVARDTLGLVKEGEAIVILPQERQSYGENQSQKAPWEMWLELFF